MDITDKIKYIRTNLLGISQDKFANKLNVTRGTIKNWESGTTKPTVSHIMMMSMICEVSTDYLVFDNHPLSLSLHGIDDEEYEILQQLISYFEKKNAKKTKDKKKDLSR